MLQNDTVLSRNWNAWILEVNARKKLQTFTKLSFIWTHFWCLKHEKYLNHFVFVCGIYYKINHQKSVLPLISASKKVLNNATNWMTFDTQKTSKRANLCSIFSFFKILKNSEIFPGFSGAERFEFFSAFWHKIVFFDNKCVIWTLFWPHKSYKFMFKKL